MTAKAKGTIQERHQSGCKGGARCCKRSYRGAVYNPATKRALRGPWSTDKGAAASWRTETLRELRAGTHHSHGRRVADMTVDAAWKTWLAMAEDGKITPRRSTRTYKASTLASYRSAYTSKVKAKFGHRLLSTITHEELQRWADELAATNATRATVAGVFDPLRAVFRKACEDDPLLGNPLGYIRLPADKSEPIEFDKPERARELLAALPVEQRALWSCAYATGLRRSELRALRVSDLHFEDDVIVLSRAWTTAEDKPREPKTRAGTREVPIKGCAAELKAHIARLRLAGDDLLFGAVRDRSKPFCPSTVERQAKMAWEAKRLKPTRLHVCRHSFASWCIELKMSPVTVQTYMGHSSITVTINRYAKMWKGQEGEHGDQIGALMAAA
jgi:integrase